ncbi:hypothetical protein BOTBODRAFT_404857 [Botryobasidium botryosum FD-172 SS1]|uniref:Uncharacterized protein n=1 Tax=Botryobasidium botryosum (strain FD-172 SS1) TaxID=930990 RepID=A0A067MM16_BOTB1|nr:hypothetical protein BOTBODRAFT_404857 [Botryobasidium botryosum FD-172 SS1]
MVSITLRRHLDPSTYTPKSRRWLIFQSSKTSLFSSPTNCPPKPPGKARDDAPPSLIRTWSVASTLWLFPRVQSFHSAALSSCTWAGIVILVVTGPRQRECSVAHP